MKFDNKIKLVLDANSKNEAVARMSVASFCLQLNPTIQDLEDIKMAISEAVTNAIIHGYEEYNVENAEVFISCGIAKDTLHIEIQDFGRGIENIEKAREPLFTSKPDMERSGMGFTVMEAFMDDVQVYSTENKGTKIILTKKISNI